MLDYLISLTQKKRLFKTKFLINLLKTIKKFFFINNVYIYTSNSKMKRIINKFKTLNQLHLIEEDL